MRNRVRPVKCELYNDNFQNFKRYNIPKAQLVVADIPYNIGVNAYASSPEWYIGGDNKNGESSKAGKTFFGTDTNFNIAEYMFTILGDAMVGGNLIVDKGFVVATLPKKAS